MAEQLSPARVVELVKMAKAMTSEEINVLVAAFGMEIAQDFVCVMIDESPEEYDGVLVVSGEGMLESAVCYLEDWFGYQDLKDVVKKYRVGDFFDIQLETKLVAIPRKA